ncbi:MAG: hypothetical protein P1P65_00910 [Treponema sp.]
MKRISIIAVETGKKKKQSLRLKRKIRNKQRKTNAYRLQKQHEAINILLQSLNRTGSRKEHELRNIYVQAFKETESRKEPEPPVSVKEDKSLFNRLRAGWRWLFGTV